MCNRNENSDEVDFVLESGGELVALEVKSGADASDFGMELFSKKFDPKAIYTVGTNRISFEEFLRTDPTMLF